MENITANNHAKRKERNKQTAEIFTPLQLVNEMLDKLLEYSPDTFSDITKTYLDPACGNGNMLIEVLKRKLKYASPLQALSTVYGCDIMDDNIHECRLRLLKVIGQHLKSKPSKGEQIQMIKVLHRNIVCTPLSVYPKGSLNYLDLPDEQIFKDEISDECAKNEIKDIVNNKLLESVKIDEI